MQKNNLSSLFRLKIIFSLVALSIFTGCVGCTSGKKGPRTRKPRMEKLPGEPGKAIILFHGLGDIYNGKSNLESLKSDLQKYFKDVTIIAPARPDSFNCPIKQQAKNIFDIIKKEELGNKNLVLVGESQGGLVAFSFYDQFSKQLKINGLITIRTPWEGAHLANAKQGDIQTFSQQLAPLINIPSMFINQILGRILATYQDDTQAGVKDLNPEKSTFLQEVKQKLPKAQIPILALAGNRLDFDKNFRSFIAVTGLEQAANQFGIEFKITQNISSLEPYWAKILGAQSGEHDIFIAYNSQIAANFSKGNKKFQSETYKDYHHFSGTYQNNAQAYQKMRDTIKAYFQDK